MGDTGFKDLTGQRFGRYTVLRRVENNKRGLAQFLCRCDCGTEKIVNGAHLRNGTTLSCGCLHKDKNKERAIDIQGKKFGKLTAVQYVGNGKWLTQCDCGNQCLAPTGSLLGGNKISCGCVHNRRNKATTKYRKLYGVWAGMLRRCENKEYEGYANYGARGICVCKEWHDFQNFANWALKNGFKENSKRTECTIERIDNNGNYEPNNCRFATQKEQNNNTRRNYTVAYDGKEFTLTELGEKFHISIPMLAYRLSAGWSIERALTQPSQRS